MLKSKNKLSLLSGPYNSINLMKNDYIQLKKFGYDSKKLLILTNLIKTFK